MQSEQEKYNPEFAPSEVSDASEEELNLVKQKSLPTSKEPHTQTEAPVPPVITTIKLPSLLKDELDAIKEDDHETYAGVITRLIQGRTPTESDKETVVVSLPRKVYQIMLMLLPGNITDQVRKGVR